MKSSPTSVTHSDRAVDGSIFKSLKQAGSRTCQRIGIASFKLPSKSDNEMLKDRFAERHAVMRYLATMSVRAYKQLVQLPFSNKVPNRPKRCLTRQVGW